MKSYPSIVKISDFGYGQDFYTFAKIDGSNLRWEYSRKSGFYKFGTRHRLFDKSDPIFGCAIDLFMAKLSEPLTQICRDNRWDKIIAFTEFWGENSFAGNHEVADEKYLTLFDVSVYKHGFLPPKDFIKQFGHLNIPNFLGIHKWNKSFADLVRSGELDGMSFEGVVGKRQQNKEIEMAKVKTQRWLDKVKSQYSQEEADKLINS